MFQNDNKIGRLASWSYLYLMNNLASSIKAIRHADTELTENHSFGYIKKKCSK